MMFTKLKSILRPKLVFIIVCVNLLSLSGCFSKGSNNNHLNWNGITLGKSTQLQVEEILGSSSEVEDFERNGQYYSLFSIPRNAENISYIVVIEKKCNCVKYIREDLTIFAAKQEFRALRVVESYGKPQLVMQAATSHYDIILIYADQGFAAEVRAQANPSEAPLISKHYFEPMPLKMYLQLWGKNLEMRREQDVHPDWAPYVYENVLGP